MPNRTRKLTEKGAAFKASMQRPMKIARATSPVTAHERPAGGGAGVEPAESDPANGIRAISPAPVDAGQSLDPVGSPLPLSGSPEPAGGGAAGGRCDEEVRKLRSQLTEAEMCALGLKLDLEAASDLLHNTRRDLEGEIRRREEERIGREQLQWDDREMLREHNANYEREIRDLEANIAALESNNLRLSAKLSRADAKALRLEGRIASLSDPRNSTAPGKQPMEVHPPSSKRRRSVTPDSNGASSSRDPGNGASSSHHRVSKTPPPPCKVCGDVHGTGDVCPFDLNVETDIKIMKKIVKKRMREGKSLPVSFKDPRNSEATKILGPLNNKGRNNMAHVYEILRRPDGTLRTTKKDLFLYIHHGMEPGVDVEPLNAQYFCLECGTPWTKHNGVYLRTLLKFWKKHFSAAYVAESNEHQGEHPSEPNKEADMDLHGNSNGEHQGESDEDSDMEREDELDGNSNRKPDGFSSEDSEQEED